MYNDLVNKALDQARGLQKIVVEAIGTSTEQAKPMIDEALKSADGLRETLVAGAAGATEAAKPHLEGALTHLNRFFDIGKGALETTVSKAHEQLEPLAEQVRRTIEATTAATVRKPADAERAPDAPQP